MLDSITLASVIPTLSVQPLQGVLYRAVARRALVGDPPYPAVRPLFDLGPAQNGARYTPRGGMRSLYLAGDPEAALAEANQAYAKLRRQQPPIMAVIPTCVLYSIDVAIETVLDLTNAAIQAAFHTDAA